MQIHSYACCVCVYICLQLLYTFDKQVCVSSCSLNKDETLLDIFTNDVFVSSVSKCLTLLIEIHPINNTKVLKAVDCRVKVQFLHQDSSRSVLESHLLLLTEDGCKSLCLSAADNVYESATR
uniref:Uncharacterized protein n=1 Tax=Salarias fasciatus TaxID=181472 RepID=A0A672JPL1_SALFA